MGKSRSNVGPPTTRRVGRTSPMFGPAGGAAAAKFANISKGLSGGLFVLLSMLGISAMSVKGARFRCKQS